MSYTAPQYVDTKEQAILALASTIADEDKSALGNGSVNRALDVLAGVDIAGFDSISFVYSDTTLGFTLGDSSRAACPMPLDGLYVVGSYTIDGSGRPSL